MVTIPETAGAPTDRATSCLACPAWTTSLGGNVTECTSTSSSGSSSSSDARATGDKITSFGDDVINNFTSSGMFAVVDCSLTDVEVLVVGGGGGEGQEASIILISLLRRYLRTFDLRSY